MSTAIKRLHQLGYYEEAEVVAVRIAAFKSGFFKLDGGKNILSIKKRKLFGIQKREEP